jgi:hypothetical protein
MLNTISVLKAVFGSFVGAAHAAAEESCKLDDPPETLDRAVAIMR